MLYIFDVDGCLIKGFLETTPCAECNGEGRFKVLDGGTLPRPRNLPTPSTPCEACKGKGFKFGKHLPYEHVELLENRLDTIALLAERPLSHFALATNQGGVALGYQSEDEVLNKMGRVVGAFHFFFGCPLSVHIACGHERAHDPHLRSEDALARRKPRGGMILDAMEAHRATVEDTLFVGDLATDRDAAEDAGVNYAWAWDFFGTEKPVAT